MSDTLARSDEPVVDAAKLASLTTSVVVAGGGAFVLFGLATQDQVDNWATIVGLLVTASGALLSYVLPLIQARKARELVTPIKNLSRGTDIYR